MTAEEREGGGGRGKKEKEKGHKQMEWWMEASMGGWIHVRLHRWKNAYQKINRAGAVWGSPALQ